MGWEHVLHVRAPGSEASTRGFRAGDPQGGGSEWLIHLSPSVLRGVVTHETRDRDEDTPRALAARIVAVPVERLYRSSRWRPRVAHHRRQDEPRQCAHVQRVCGARGQAHWTVQRRAVNVRDGVGAHRRAGQIIADGSIFQRWHQRAGGSDLTAHDLITHLLVCSATGGRWLCGLASTCTSGVTLTRTCLH